jgi:hypothetical protein
MGKYTDLARKNTDGAQEGAGVLCSNNVNINSIYSNRVSSMDKPTSARPEDTLQGSTSVEMPQGVASGSKGGAEVAEKRATNLRTTNLTNLSEDKEVWVATQPGVRRYTRLARRESTPLRCIHDMAPDKCAVCGGYVRWLIADEGRLRRAQASPEEVRREFWRSVGGVG